MTLPATIEDRDRAAKASEETAKRERDRAFLELEVWSRYEAGPLGSFVQDMPQMQGALTGLRFHGVV